MNMQPMHLWQLLLNNPEWALVIVGIVTLFFVGWQAAATANSAKATEFAARATRDSVAAIQKQIDLMERQTEATEDAAIAARKSVEIIISKERARIQLEVESPTIPSPDDPFPIGQVGFRVRCHGTTPANIIETRIWAQITDSKEPYRGDTCSAMSIPSVLTPTPEGIEGTTALSYSDQLISDGVDICDSVRRKKLFVHFYGRIEYQDIFEAGRTWIYSFRYIYEPNPWSVDDGTWTRCGIPNDNVEMEVSRPSFGR